MKQIKNKNSFIVNLSLCGFFILYPFLALLVAFFFIINGEKRTFPIVIISLWFGLYGYTFIPGEGFDFVRHLEMYDSFSMMSWELFFELMKLSLSFDNLFSYLYFFFGSLGFTNQIVGFIAAFPFYLLLLLTINNVVNRYIKTQHEREKGIIFFILFLMSFSLTVPWIFSGIRNANAVMVLLYLISYKDFKYSTFRYKILFIIPVLLHFSLLPIVVLFVLSQLIKNNSRNLLFWIMVSLFPLLNVLLLGLGKILGIFGRIGDYLGQKVESYLVEGVVVGNYTGAGFRYYLVIIPLVIISFFICLKLKRIKLGVTGFEAFLRFFILYEGYMILVSNTYLFSRAHILFVYLVSIVLVVLYYNNLYPKFKSMLGFLLFYVCFNFFPSTIMGKEYMTYNSVIFQPNIFEIVNTKVYEYEYWKSK
ncbi:EpsG family protein [Myroides sp. C15-4]|uniref:EpsG family protein n=1 Tax=Myroides sp. C15-4 TaxID=3400532 RepID=UPI003D2F72A3